MIFTNGLEVKEPMDKEVIPCLILLNTLQGIKTWGSCSGHGKPKGLVSFYCSNYKSLKGIIMGVQRSNDKTKSNKEPLWHISPICNGYDVIWDIRMYSDDYEQHINTMKYWNRLHQSLIASVRSGKEETR